MDEMLKNLNGPWSNAACMGYCLIAMRRAGLRPTAQRRVLLAMEGAFDDVSVEKAEKTGYAQLLSMSKEFVTMKASDPRYDYYKRTLTDAGWIKDDTPNLLETNRGLTGQSWKGDPANKWGTGTSNRQSQSTGRTASQSSVPQRAQVAANAIKGQRNHGSDDQTIFDSLKYQGYTDDEIWKAFELAG